MRAAAGKGQTLRRWNDRAAVKDPMRKPQQTDSDTLPDDDATMHIKLENLKVQSRESVELCRHRSAIDGGRAGKV
jgi:hypothetical protein